MGNFCLISRTVYLNIILFETPPESIIDTLERVLKSEKEDYQEISTEHKKELDNRLESYKENPNDVLDWDDVLNT